MLRLPKKRKLLITRSARFPSPECCKNWANHEPGIDHGSTETIKDSKRQEVIKTKIESIYNDKTKLRHPPKS